MIEPDTTTQTPLYGLQCGDPLHRGDGRVYVRSVARHRIEGLARGNRCYELVVSHDQGETWEVAL